LLFAVFHFHLPLIERPLAKGKRKMENSKWQMNGQLMLPDSCAMNKSIRRILSLTALIAMIYDHASAVTQNKLWREIKGKPLVKFDWNCASTSIYPKAKLSRLVEVAQKREDASETAPDRAFAFDLNNDGRPEYFVPLVCGATGNCTWGVFALRPSRFLGTVNGQYIYIYILPIDCAQKRSEEHTSELQSLTNLAYRLLLQKKK